MLDIQYQQWRDENKNRRYPFADTASLRNGDGVAVAESLFDDARVYPVGASVGLFLRRIEVTDTRLDFHIADPVSGELASGGFSFGGAAPNNIVLSDVYGRPAGILVSDASKLSALPALYGEGDFSFEADQTEFAASVAIPSPQPGVRGILLDDGNIVSGDIYLVGTDGVVLSEEDGNIRVDVIGDPYALMKACAEQGIEFPKFCGLRTINQITPDANGDFKITIGGNLAPDNILRIEQDGGQVKLRALGGTGLSG